MSGSGKIASRTLPLLLVSLAIFTLHAFAQVEASNKEAATAKKRPLEFTLRVLTPTVCVGVPLKLRLEVKNTGQEPIKLNRAYFWNNYSEYPTESRTVNEDGEFFFTHVWPVSTSEDIFILAPGRTFVDHRYLSPEAGVVKAGPGNYTLEIGEHGRGVKGRFELKNCEREKLRSN